MTTDTFQAWKLRARLTLAAGIAGVAMWLVAGLWHTVVLARFYERETGATHAGTGVILVAYLVLGGFMAYLYRRTWRGGLPPVEGLKLGIVVGLLWVFPHELAMAGAHGEPLGYVFQNAAWHAGEQGLGGVIVGLVAGRLSPDPRGGPAPKSASPEAE